MGILQLNELAFKKRASVTDKGAVAEKNSVHCSHKVKKQKMVKNDKFIEIN